MRAARVLTAAFGCVVLVSCATEPAAPPPQSARPDEVTVASGADGVQAVDIDADDANHFHPSLVNAQTGPLRVSLHHVGTGAPHNWTATDLPGARVPLARGGETRTARFVVGRPGDYRFVCTIHEAQGSVGRLVVRGR